MPRSICREVKALTNLVRRRLESCHASRPQQGPTGMQGFFIGYLVEHPDQDVFQRDLEAEFRIRRSTATGILQLMEKRGLIRRQPVERDARLKKLVLTDQARLWYCQMEKDFSLVEQELTSGLSSQELAAFFVTLDKMKQNLEYGHE